MACRRCGVCPGFEPQFYRKTKCVHCFCSASQHEGVQLQPGAPIDDDDGPLPAHAVAAHFLTAAAAGGAGAGGAAGSAAGSGSGGGAAGRAGGGSGTPRGSAAGGSGTSSSAAGARPSQVAVPSAVAASIAAQAAGGSGAPGSSRGSLGGKAGSAGININAPPAPVAGRAPLGEPWSPGCRWPLFPLVADYAVLEIGISLSQLDLKDAPRSLFHDQTTLQRAAEAVSSIRRGVVDVSQLKGRWYVACSLSGPAAAATASHAGAAPPYAITKLSCTEALEVRSVNEVISFNRMVSIRVPRDANFGELSTVLAELRFVSDVNKAEVKLGSVEIKCRHLLQAAIQSSVAEARLTISRRVTCMFNSTAVLALAPSLAPPDRPFAISPTINGTLLRQGFVFGTESRRKNLIVHEEAVELAFSSQIPCQFFRLRCEQLRLQRQRLNACRVRLDPPAPSRVKRAQSYVGSGSMRNLNAATAGTSTIGAAATSTSPPGAMPHPPLGAGPPESNDSLLNVLADVYGVPMEGEPGVDPVRDAAPASLAMWMRQQVARFDAMTDQYTQLANYYSTQFAAADMYGQHCAAVGRDVVDQQWDLQRGKIRNAFFKPSSRKKDPLLCAVPINLHAHLLIVQAIRDGTTERVSEAALHAAATRLPSSFGGSVAIPIIAAARSSLTHPAKPDDAVEQFSDNDSDGSSSGSEFEGFDGRFVDEPLSAKRSAHRMSMAVHRSSAPESTPSASLDGDSDAWVAALGHAAAQAVSLARPGSRTSMPHAGDHSSGSAADGAGNAGPSQNAGAWLRILDSLPAGAVTAEGSMGSDSDSDHSEAEVEEGIAEAAAVQAEAVAVVVAAEATPDTSSARSHTGSESEPAVEVTDDTLIAPETSVHATITMGAPAHHAFGFSKGGLHRLRGRLPALSAGDPTSTYLQGWLSWCDTSIKSDGTTVENSSVFSRDAVQEALGIMMREDAVLSQTLTGTTASLAVQIDLALATGDFAALKSYHSHGFVVHLESLLSTAGHETAMLEDLICGMNLMKRVQYVLRKQHPGSKVFGATSHSAAPGPAVWSAESAAALMDDGALDACRRMMVAAQLLCNVQIRVPDSVSDEAASSPTSAQGSMAARRKLSGFFDEPPTDPLWEVELYVAPDIWDKLPAELRNSPFPVIPLVFTQGINEMQSFANALSEAQFQRDVNRRSFFMLSKVAEDLSTAWPAAKKQRLQYLLAELSEALRQEAVATGKHYRVLTLSSDIVRLVQGGRLTCCKSGKDRTAMSVTYEEARILSECHGLTEDNVLPAANLMREHGVRLTVCHKNVGKPRYAFNAFQVKMLPPVYRPPLTTIGTVDS